MKCIECGGTTLEARESRSVTLAGVTFKAAVPVRRCKSCKATSVSGPAMVQLERRAALELAKRGLRSGEVFRALRKGLGMRAVDLAGVLDVTPESISRWERDVGEVDAATFATMGALVAEKLEGRSDTLDRLTALQAPRRAPKAVNLDLKSA